MDLFSSIQKIQKDLHIISPDDSFTIQVSGMICETRKMKKLQKNAMRYLLEYYCQTHPVYITYTAEYLCFNTDVRERFLDLVFALV